MGDEFIKRNFSLTPLYEIEQRKSENAIQLIVRPLNKHKSYDFKPNPYLARTRMFSSRVNFCPTEIVIHGIPRGPSVKKTTYDKRRNELKIEIDADKVEDRTAFTIATSEGILCHFDFQFNERFIYGVESVIQFAMEKCKPGDRSKLKVINVRDFDKPFRIIRRMDRVILKKYEYLAYGIKEKLISPLKIYVPHSPLTTTMIKNMDPSKVFDFPREWFYLDEFKLEFVEYPVKHESTISLIRFDEV